MKIFLTGFMGCGKSTIGRQLANIIGYGFIDTDTQIEQQQGCSVSDIFANAGETAFRKMERAYLQSLDIENFTVVATGGGMPCFFDNMDWMLAHGRTVYLHTQASTLAQRLKHTYATRPLIAGKTDEELLDYVIAKLAEREQFYKRSEITVSTEKFNFDELLKAIGLMR